ncbi:MAG: DUF5606 domain-containing protein [Bacteroidales bacterium]|nr:DUF5606 domain-containing protein [Bacteroidales bacterium]
MELKDIMAISGHSGLFKFISQGRHGIIVESLSDGKRTNISASAKVSSLSDIAIFTNDTEVPFKEVLKKIKDTENGAQAISQKSDDKELKKYFEKILPEYDRERVYTSDIKKVITWYNQLQALNLLDILEKEEKPAEENSPSTEEEIK